MLVEQVFACMQRVLFKVLNRPFKSVVLYLTIPVIYWMKNVHHKFVHT